MKTLRKTASLAFGVLALALHARAAAPATTDPMAMPAPSSSERLTYRCILAPERGQCDAVYRKALHDSSPEASSVRDAYANYARYLVGTNTLTDADKQYLKANQTDVPNDLTPVQISGLHNVINDPALQKNADDRKAAVTNYLSRADEANIYCGFNSCPGEKRAGGST